MEEAISSDHARATNLYWLANSTDVFIQTRHAENFTLEIVSDSNGTQDPLTIESGSLANLSPGGDSIAYFHEGSWRIWSINDDKAKVEFPPLGNHVTPSSRPIWLGDSNRFVALEVIRRRHGVSVVEPTIKGKSGSRYYDVGDYADRLESRGGGTGYGRIRVLDAKHPENQKIFDLGDLLPNSAAWDDNGNLYFVALKHFSSGQAYTSIRKLSLSSGEIIEVYRLDGGYMQATAISVSPDGKFLALAIDLDNRLFNEYNSLAIIDTSNGEIERITYDQPVWSSEFDIQWSPNGHSIFFLARDAGMTHVFRATLDGVVEKVSRGQQNHSLLRLSPDATKVVYRRQDLLGNEQIIQQYLSSQTIDILKTISMAEGEYCLGEAKVVSWASGEYRIFGYLFFPANFDQTTEYPLFVSVHGGGIGARLTPSYTLGRGSGVLGYHAWASEGYVVFVPDFRSSGDYGPRPAATRYANPTWDSSLGIMSDAMDIENGVDWLIDQGFIDTERLVLFGHSAGQGRVTYILMHADRYAAAIGHDGLSPGLFMYALNTFTGPNTGVRFSEGSFQNGMKLSDDAELYTGGVEFEAFKISTPYLLMVGNEELGAITIPSEITFTAMRQYGMPTKMLKYLDDGHVPHTDKSALHRFLEMNFWVEQHLKKD